MPGLHHAIPDLEVLVRLLEVHDVGHPLVAERERITKLKEKAIAEQAFEWASNLRDEERRLQKRIRALAEKIADSPAMHRLQSYGLVDLDGLTGRKAFPDLTVAGRRLAETERLRR